MRHLLVHDTYDTATILHRCGTATLLFWKRTNPDKVYREHFSVEFVMYGMLKARRNSIIDWGRPFSWPQTESELAAWGRIRNARRRGAEKGLGRVEEV